MFFGANRPRSQYKLVVLYCRPTLIDTCVCVCVCLEQDVRIPLKTQACPTRVPQTCDTLSLVPRRCVWAGQVRAEWCSSTGWCSTAVRDRVHRRWAWLLTYSYDRIYCSGGSQPSFALAHGYSSKMSKFPVELHSLFTKVWISPLKCFAGFASGPQSS